jgi:hypothetical protein
MSGNIELDGSLGLSVTNTQGNPSQPGPSETGALNPGVQVAGTTCMLVSAAGKPVGWITFGGNVKAFPGGNLAAVLAGCGGSISPSGVISGPNTEGGVPAWDSMTPIEKGSISVYGMIDINPANQNASEGAGRG